MNKSLGFIVAIVLTNLLMVNGQASQNDTYKTTPAYITSYGYSLETHTITTEDGYILTYYRIPTGRKKPLIPFMKNKKVVLLQHGLFASSSCWFVEKRPAMLPFMLADDGYDVWIGNSRGSTYSRAHTNSSYRSEDPVNTYWSFRWVLYDITAGIDYITKVTRKKRLIYIGHSQGTTELFVMLSLRPEYNSKLKLAVLYSPVAFMSEVKGPIQYLAPIAKDATYTSTGGILTSWLGVGKFLPDSFVEFLHQQDPALCDQALIKYGICANILFLLAGFDPKQLDYDRLPIALAQFPDTSSIMSLLHYGQLMEPHGPPFRFQRFDYGASLNPTVYHGSQTPPSFDLSLITTPIALYYGENDWLSPVVDVEYLRTKLPNVVEFKKIAWKDWNHLDYISAINATELVYEPTLRLMKRFH